jgi:arginine decarboxylase
MKVKYIDLIEQTFDFPQEEFTLDENELVFHDISMMELVKRYGTPLKFTYLPIISQQIAKAKRWFNVAMAKVDYKGKYHYCYCTKSSHFEPVLTEALKNDIHIETSSAFDINIVERLVEDGKLKKSNYVVCNGYKPDRYIENIARLINNGYNNVIPVIDNIPEIEKLTNQIESRINIGIRIASEEEPKFEFYTSRLGIGYKDIIPFYVSKVKDNPKVQLKMLHFFINTGIRDTSYYWSELLKCLGVYVELKKVCPTLDSLNIGGGFPIKNSLSFDFDYEYMTEEIVRQIKAFCEENDVPEPDIFTEFGSFTVGEAGGAIFSVLYQKAQNDKEKWNMIDSSFMTTLPDSWAISKRFLMLPINRWEDEYERVLLGGLTCDSDDYYNSEQHVNAIYLPKYDEEKPLYLAFFNTGAYQESVGGYGGIQHCLTPAPKHVLIDFNEDGKITSRLFAKEQSPQNMLKILGY